MFFQPAQAASESSLTWPKIEYVPQRVEGFKPFYIHFNRQRRKDDHGHARHSPRGFTAFIEPGDTSREVKVRIAFCSYKDEFNKKVGREQAHAKDAQVINTRDLPKVLAGARAMSDGLVDMYMNGTYYIGEYQYVFRYIV